MNKKYITKTSLISRLPFYYGWVILIVGSLGVLASIPGQTMGVSVFTDHYIEHLKISRVSLSSAYMAGTLASSFLIPFAGIFYDKKGAKVTSSIAAVALALFISLLGFSKPISVFLTSFFHAPPTLVVMILMIIGFFGIRFFGQGVLTIVSRGMIARWFTSRRGLAVGLMGLVTSFGFSYAPQPLQSLINYFDYDKALLFIALILVGVFLPIVLIFFKNDPASCNLEMEQGLKEKIITSKYSSKDALIEKDVHEAKKDIMFWIILVFLGYWGMYNTAITFHIVSIFNEVGTDALAAVKIFLPISIISVISRFIASFISDRFNIRYIFYVFSISLMGASLAIFLLSTTFGYFLLIISLGIAGGLFGMLNIVTWPKLYGKKHLGAISGFAMSIIVAGSAIGPWFFSIIFKYTQSYKSVGLFGLVFSTLLALLFLIISIKKKSN